MPIKVKDPYLRNVYDQLAAIQHRLEKSNHPDAASNLPFVHAVVENFSKMCNGDLTAHEVSALMATLDDLHGIGVFG